MVKRIPNEDITYGFPKVLPPGHPDLLWLNPKDVIIGDSALSTGYQSSPAGSSGASLVAGLNSTVTQSALLNSSAATLPVVDTVNLVDIESITYSQYYDTVSKAAKYKAIIKIRNSSSNKSNVQGVDARIYNPSGQ